MTLPGFPHVDGPRRDASGDRAAQPDPGADPRNHRGARPYDRPASGPAAPAGAGQDGRKLSKVRGAATRTMQFTRRTATRIDAVSGAHGARESGLRTLIWSNCASMAGDALVAVYLAATLFFAAPGEQQRGNVALYLLVTVAPFAVIAPIIGPFLDRIDRGRRLALAGTFLARAFLCFLLATNTDSTVLLYICALLCLVFSRAFMVLKAAVVPRVLPKDLQLVAANSRMHVFGMIGAGVLGAVGAGMINLFNAIEPVEQATAEGTLAEPTLGFSIELFLTVAVFAAGAIIPMKLPASVDTDEGEGKVSMTRVQASSVRISLGTHVVTALRSTSAQRFLGGFLTFFLVFYVQSTQQGFTALALLAALGAAAGVGSMAGTALGTRLATGASPDMLVLITTGTAVAFCVAAAVSPSVGLSIAVAAIAAIASALGKLALDAIIQREIPASFRSSAFSRSETLLQLSWVAGGTVGILLPTSRGTLWLGWTVAAVFLTIAFGLTLVGRHRAVQEGPRAAEIEQIGPGESRLDRLRQLAARGKRGATRVRRKPRSNAEQAEPGAEQPESPPVSVHDPSSSRPPAPANAPPGPPQGAPPSRSAPPQQSGPPAPPAAQDGEWLDTPAPTSPTRPLPDFRGLRR